MDKKINILAFDENLEKDRILVYYKGPFIDTVLASIGDRINEIEMEPLLNKKVFSIFLELAQNVSYYSEEREHHEQKSKSYGKGSFLICDWNSHYSLTSANLIKKSWGPVITEKCKKINTLDVDALRQWKRELRSQPMHDGQLGANIGLIDMALKAGSPLEVDITPFDDDYDFFALSINVSKTINNNNNNI
ncbi:MAG TPA: SiaB family protein kinase [Ohtaekwangia sp.]|uniref:SiaB family protein kinase n=1 Tax=Ohtaekwangia sp. TaxID=2066019 RepID=UPI002F93AF0C